jgi:anti-anti-sigma factor
VDVYPPYGGASFTLVPFDPEPHARTPLLQVEGELDLAAVEDLRNALDQTRHEVAHSGATVLWLDLTGVVFLDSACLHHLERFTDEMRAEDRTIRLTGLSRAVERIVRLQAVDLGIRDEPGPADR